MTSDAKRDDIQPKVPAEHPDPAAAAAGGGGADRPGFDLGGASDRTGADAGLPPGGPKGSTAQGADGTGRASGMAGTGAPMPKTGGR